MSKDDRPDPPPLFSGRHPFNQIHEGQLDSPHDQNIRLQLLKEAVVESLIQTGHPLAPARTTVLEDWSDEHLRGYVEDQLEVAELRAAARALKAKLELTFRFPEGEPLSITLE